MVTATAAVYDVPLTVVRVNSVVADSALDGIRTAAVYGVRAAAAVESIVVYAPPLNGKHTG